ncbi:excisionase family DNA-binding protein [Kitasatospora sp. NPDC101183]|uniref:excisionase family DNA-binding protein n=1 Tax=Kitasatospora sp. NPDC101183 TaxID=3364100 RepID=UPI0037FCDD8C
MQVEGVPELFEGGAQVSGRLGTSERFPRRLIAEHRIAFVKIGTHVRIAESVLNAYIEASTVPAIRPVRSGGRRFERAA